MSTCKWCGGRVGLGISCACYTVDYCTMHPAIVKMQAEIDRLRAVIERIDDECGGDVSPGYIQSIARHALMDLPNAQDQRRV